jgi:hypothetical protein
MSDGLFTSEVAHRPLEGTTNVEFKKQEPRVLTATMTCEIHKLIISNDFDGTN